MTGPKEEKQIEKPFVVEDEKNATGDWVAELIPEDPEPIGDL